MWITESDIKHLGRSRINACILYLFTYLKNLINMKNIPSELALPRKKKGKKPAQKKWMINDPCLRLPSLYSHLIRSSSEARPSADLGEPLRSMALSLWYPGLMATTKMIPSTTAQKVVTR